MEIVNLVVLLLSGLLLTLAGGARLHRPTKSLCLQTYLKRPGVDLEDDVDILNEMRGGAAVTVLGGLTILAGTAIPGLRPTSFAVAGVIFLGFAAGRSISIVLDGKPNRDLLNGTIAEWLFGVLNIGCLVFLLT